MLIISYVRLFLHRISDIMNFATAIQEVHKPPYIVDCSVSKYYQTWRGLHKHCGMLQAICKLTQNIELLGQYLLT